MEEAEVVVVAWRRLVMCCDICVACRVCGAKIAEWYDWKAGDLYGETGAYGDMWRSESESEVK